MTKFAVSLLAVATFLTAAFAEKTERDDHILRSGDVAVVDSAGASSVDFVGNGNSAYMRQLQNAADGDNGES